MQMYTILGISTTSSFKLPSASTNNLPPSNNNLLNNNVINNNNNNNNNNSNTNKPYQLTRTNNNSSTTQLNVQNTTPRSGTISGGHFRTRSFGTGNQYHDIDMYHQQQAYNRNGQNISTSFTPPDTFDLMDYEQFLMQYRRRLEQQQQQATNTTPNKFNLQLPLANIPTVTSAGNTNNTNGNTTPRGMTTPRGGTTTTTTPRGGTTTPRGGPTTPRGGPTTPRRERNEGGEDGVSEEEVLSPTGDDRVNNNNITKPLLGNNQTSNIIQNTQVTTSNNIVVTTNNVVDSLFSKVTAQPQNQNNNNQTKTKQPSVGSESLLTVELKPRRNQALGTGLLSDYRQSLSPLVRYIATFVPHKRGGVHKVNVPIPTLNAPSSSSSSMNFTFPNCSIIIFSLLRGGQLVSGIPSSSATLN